MSNPVITKYSGLKRAASALAAAHDDVTGSVEVHADKHAARLDAMRARLQEDQRIADGIANRDKAL